MTLLEVFFIISGLIIFILALDIAKKEKFNALHFFIFILIGSWLLVFTFFPWVLNNLWRIFGLQRWADVLVYGSIIFLLYFVLLLLTKVENNKHHISRMVRELAINASDKKIISGNEVFLVRSYNEAEVLETTLYSILDSGYKNILVVDDWSTDSTHKILLNLQDRFSEIVVLKHFKNRGGWAALETWFEYLRRFGETEFVVTFDADGQHRISDYETFMRAFKKHPHLDIVFGSRFLKKDSLQNIPFIRKIVLKWGRIFTYLLSWIKLSDAHNWYRVFRLATLQKIRLTADSMAYASEITEQVAQNHLAYGEVSVEIIYTEYSLSKWQKSSNALFIAWDAIWAKFFR